MAICSKCGREAKSFLSGRWFCDECFQAVLDRPAPAAPRKKIEVSFIDETGRTIRAPLCSICRNRISMFVVFGDGICRACSAAGKDFPPDQEEFEGSTGKTYRFQKGRSIVDFPEEYVCVDVETTGRSPEEDEIIEIAALHIKGGNICGKFTSLVKPQGQHVPLPYEEIQKRGYTSFLDVTYDVFEDFAKERIVPDEIQKLTGITDAMLVDAPTADVVMPRFYEFVGDRILVGHNVDFDMNFLYDACENCGLFLTNDYVDTLRISRNLLPQLSHHRLSDLVSHFGIVQDTAHRAEADAAATAECLEAMKALVLEKTSIEEYRRTFVEPERRRMSRSTKNLYARKAFHPGDLVLPDTVDPSHPLCWKSIVFTGELSVPRADAAQMAVNVGALVKTSVSSKTNFLVVGQQDPALVGSAGFSGSEKKARDLNASGKGNIKILSEHEFMELVSEKEAGVL